MATGERVRFRGPRRDRLSQRLRGVLGRGTHRRAARRGRGRGLFCRGRAPEGEAVRADQLVGTGEEDVRIIPALDALARRDP